MKKPTKKAERELEKAAKRLLELYEIPPLDLARFAFGETDTFWLALANIDWHDDSEPNLGLLVIDATTGDVAHRADPIGALLSVYSKPGTVECDERLERAVAALQSGIDRIRTFQNGTPETT